MYFEEHQKQNIIAENESIIWKAEYNKEYYKTYERPKKEEVTV